MDYTDGYSLRQLRVWHQLIRQSALATATAIEASFRTVPIRPAPPQSGQKSNTHVWVFRFNANAWDNLILNLRSENETN